MTSWSSFRETQLGERGAAAVRLADVLSQGERFSHVDSGAALFPERMDEVFARGRWRANEIRPFVQCFDFDLEMMSSTRIRGQYPSSLCINLVLDGAWTSVIEGRSIEMTRTGMPGMFAAGQAFESIMAPRKGQRIRAVSLYIASEFFQGTAHHDDSLMRAFSRFFKPGIQHLEFRSCDVLRSLMHRLHDNPYDGPMRRLYAESLALSALVELGAHVEGRCRKRPLPRGHRDIALEARTLLDQEIESPRSVNVLAKQLGTSEVTLRRLFKATFGVTMVDYMRNCRLDAARHLLQEGRLRISEIAYRVGYSEPANFTAAYRQRFGHPPSQELRMPGADRCA